MLRSRFRAVTSKQALMADQSSQHSQSQNPTSPVSSFLSSPKFKSFITQNNFPANEALISPNSILDNKPFSLTNPFWNDKINHLRNPTVPLSSTGGTSSRNKHAWKNSHSRANNVGLKLIDTLEDDYIKENPLSKFSNQSVLVASKLRVQIPPIPVFPARSRNSQELESGSASSCAHQTRDHSDKRLLVSEMEQSEDYTCVIAHGPNPRTTHIFNNFVVEGYYSLSDNSKFKTVSPEKETYFLSFCYTCQKKLDQTKDIYIYRGEKAFCSSDCRYQEMLVDGAEDAGFYA